MNKLHLTPLTIGEAKAFVTAKHRHHEAPVSALFAIGASLDAEIELTTYHGDVGSDQVPVEHSPAGSMLSAYLAAGGLATRGAL